MNYIYILDYETGTCIVRIIPSDLDVEEWLYSEGFSQSSIYYMITNTLSLEINV